MNRAGLPAFATFLLLIGAMLMGSITAGEPVRDPVLDENIGEITRSSHLETRAGGGEEINISGDEVTTVSAGYYGQVTISGNATMKVLGDIRVHGKIYISDGGMLDIRGAKVTVNPPPIGVNDNVIRVTGEGMIYVQRGGTLTVNPQPLTQEDKGLRNNASFIEIDDDGEILVEDSTFTATLPEDVIHESIRVTGGTILVTGNGRFTALGSEINAYLAYVMDDIIGEDVLLERWFWMSSQMFGTIRIENSTCTLHEPGQTLFKPTNGEIIIKNSTIHGNVRPETISRFHISDSEIHYVNDQLGYSTIHEAMEFNDHARGTIERTTLFGDIKAGWSSTNTFLGKAHVDINFIDCTFHSTRILGFANTSMNMVNCIIDNGLVSFEISDNTTLHLRNTDVESILIECGDHWRLTAIKENITIIMEDSRIGTLFSPEPDVIFNLFLYNGSGIDEFAISFNGEYANKTAYILLSSGSSAFVQHSNSSNIFFTLRNSDPPPGDYNETVFIHERYESTGMVELNGAPLEGAAVTIHGDGWNMSTTSRPDGSYFLEYDARVMQGSRIILDREGKIALTAGFMGFEYAGELLLSSDHAGEIIFEDHVQPSVSNISWGPESFNHKKYITVSATITDDGAGVISSARLEYRVNGGTWKNLSMFNVHGDTYEAILPRFDIGDEVDLRIVAADPLGNRVVGEERRIEIGNEPIYSGIVILIILTLALLVIGLIKLRLYTRKRRYLRKEFTGHERPHMLTFSMGSNPNHPDNMKGGK